MIKTTKNGKTTWNGAKISHSWRQVAYIVISLNVYQDKQCSYVKHQYSHTRILPLSLILTHSLWFFLSRTVFKCLFNMQPTRGERNSSVGTKRKFFKLLRGFFFSCCCYYYYNMTGNVLFCYYCLHIFTISISLIDLELTVKADGFFSFINEKKRRRLHH